MILFWDRKIVFYTQRVHYMQTMTHFGKLRFFEFQVFLLKNDFNLLSVWQERKIFRPFFNRAVEICNFDQFSNEFSLLTPWFFFHWKTQKLKPNCYLMLYIKGIIYQVARKLIDNFTLQYFFSIFHYKL